MNFSSVSQGNLLKLLIKIFSEYFNFSCSQEVCTEPFVWKKLQNSAVSNNQILQCPAMNNEAHEPLYLNAVGDAEQVFFEGTSMHSCIFNIVLSPTVVLKNLLPVNLVYVSEKGRKEQIVQPSGSFLLPAIVPGRSLMCIRVIFQTFKWGFKITCFFVSLA
jgi:hypothetical protein